jgi:hypothetical protein
VYDGGMSKVRAPTMVFEELVERVLRGPGVTRPEQRAEAMSEKGGPAILEKVRRAAHKVTDEDVKALRDSGLSDDEIFELTIAAAIGVSKRRLEAAMRAIDAAG